MKRTSNEDSPNVKAAIMKYWRFVNDHGDDELQNDDGESGWNSVSSDLSGEPEYEFAKGFFVGSGLSIDEAVEAAEYVCANGW